ncbi:hypothetical protein KDM41_14665 [bacterium]|nr:hypothetical protein [bacterium]
MILRNAGIPRQPTRATIVATVGVLAGFFLAAVDWAFLAIAAVSMFAPGILRELGWLRDKDEAQLEAARRAGYHAYLAGGLFVFLLYVWLRASEATVAFPSGLLEGALAVMWFTWFCSSLYGYWGRVRTSVTMLNGIGGAWLGFCLLSGEGNLGASLMQSLLCVPFFLAALLAPRWPRVVGVLLLGASVFFFRLFGLAAVFAGDPTRMGRMTVIVLFIGPLFAAGVALLGARRLGTDEDDENEAGDTAPA